MTLLYISIPIMFLAIAIATVPLIWAMIYQGAREGAGAASADVAMLAHQAREEEDELAA